MARISRIHRIIKKSRQPVKVRQSRTGRSLQHLRYPIDRGRLLVGTSSMYSKTSTRSKRRKLLLSTAVVAGALSVTAAVCAIPVKAQENAKFNFLIYDNDYNLGSNWGTGAVPTGTAFFEYSHIYDKTKTIRFSENTTVGGWTFEATEFINGITNFTFNNDTAHRTLTFTGAGINIVEGGVSTVTINNNGAGSGTIFLGTSTAGNATINASNTSNSLGDSEVIFLGTSNAGRATINAGPESNIFFRENSTAHAAHINGKGRFSTVQFRDESTAGSATISISDTAGLQFREKSNADNATIDATNGYLSWTDESTAGNATINASNTEVGFAADSTAGNATINSGSDNIIRFINRASGGNATINNLGARSLTEFTSSSNAGNATINNSNRVLFSQQSTAGGATLNNSGDDSQIVFAALSGAGNATINNSGDDSSVSFLLFSRADNATINNDGKSSLVHFEENGHANSAIINNNGSNSSIAFSDASRANSAIINNNGPNSSIAFSDESRANSATLNNAGLNSTVAFSDTSNAGSAAINNLGTKSVVNFVGQSSAADAAINNEGTESIVSFAEASSADAADITNNGENSLVRFADNSTAGNATIVNSGLSSEINFDGLGSAADATINNEGTESIVSFAGASSADAADITNNGENSLVRFADNSTAGDANITNNGENSLVRFANNSTAGDANITNNGENSLVRFIGNSTAGNATIVNSGLSSEINFDGLGSAADAAINNEGTESIVSFAEASSANAADITNNGENSLVRFADNSTAGDANITNNGENSLVRFIGNSNAENSTIDNYGESSEIRFDGGSTAGDASINNDGDASIVTFAGYSRAEAAHIVNNGNNSSVSFIGSSNAENSTIDNYGESSEIKFDGESTAGDAIINNSGFVGFYGTSTAGSASITNKTVEAVVDFSGSNGLQNDGRLSVGSLAGAGSFFLGSNELSAGENGLTTEVSGVISDCGPTGQECTENGALGGALIKAGTGSFVLSGANTYTGPTTVNQGSLIVNGSIESYVTVNSGGTLGGTGQFQWVTATPGGIIAPGNSIATNSIGTMSINGPFSMMAGSKYEVEVNAVGESDRVDVIGPASISGSNLVVDPLGDVGLYAETTIYDGIISANTLRGTFAHVGSTSVLLDASAGYNASTVDLTLTRVPFKEVSGLRTNQFAVATVFENDYPEVTTAAMRAAAGDVEGADYSDVKGDIKHIDPEFQGVQLDPSTASPFSLLTAKLFAIGTVPDYRKAMNQLSGVQYAQLLQSLLWSARPLNESITDQMDCGGIDAQIADLNGDTVDRFGCFRPGEVHAWGRMWGGWNSNDGDVSVPGYDEDQFAFWGGIDYAISPALFVGFAGGYFDSAMDFGSWGGGTIDYDGGQFAVYGGWDNAVWYNRAIVSFGFYSNDSHRKLTTIGLSSGPEGRFDADVVSFYNELGRRFAVGTSQVTPFLGVSVGNAQMDGFTERDPHRTGARLKVESSSADSLSTVVGLRYNGVWGAFRPQLAVGWEHEFEDTAHSITVSFVDSPSKSKFTVTGSDLSDDSLFVDAGGAYLLGDSSDVSLRYVGRWQSDYDSQSVMGRYTYKFGGASEALPVTEPLKLGNK